MNVSQAQLDRELVDSIDVEAGLSIWEADFVDSLLRWLRGCRGNTLTLRQRDVAEQIQRRLDEEGGGS